MYERLSKALSESFYLRQNLGFLFLKIVPSYTAKHELTKIHITKTNLVLHPSLQFYSFPENYYMIGTKLEDLTKIVAVTQTTELLTSFPHFKPKVATHSHHTTSHHKRTFLTRLLFTSFAHFEPKVATHSHHITSDQKII